jgi:hypothetical protein
MDSTCTIHFRQQDCQIQPIKQGGLTWAISRKQATPNNTLNQEDIEMAVHYEAKNGKQRNGTLLFMVEAGGIRRIWAAQDAASLDRKLAQTFVDKYTFYQI